MRKLALFVLGFSAAIFCFQYLPNTVGALITAGAAVAATLLLMLAKKRPAAIARAVLLGIAVGALWNTAYMYLFFGHAEALNGYEGGVEAVVSDYSVAAEYGSKTEISIRFANRPTVKAILYDYNRAQEFAPGDIIQFEGELKLASDKLEHDYFASRGIPLFAYSDDVPELCGRVERAELRYFHRIAARAVKDKIAEIFPASSQPFMTAILTGDRTRLNNETYLFSVLATTGAAHIVAVSGMHVAFLVSMLRLLLGRKRLASIICIPIILAFMAITGFAASVVRAGIMQIILLMGSVLRRDYDDISSLSLALLILLTINPVSAKNGGLQLSFAATLGIILFGGKVQSVVRSPFEAGKRLHRLYKNALSRAAVNFVCAAIASSFGALAFTLPLTAIMFGYVSVVAPLVNLLILWAVTLAFSSGIICVVLGFMFPAAAIVLAWIPNGLTAYIAWITGAISKLPFASVYTSSFYIRAWLVFMYTEFAVFCMVACRAKLPVFILSNLVVLAFSVCFAYIEAGCGEITVSVLDVGQGQCVLVTSNGETAVIDCGGSLSTNAGDIAAEHLNSFGETKVDALILTHFHDDHAGGAVELMRRTEIDRLIAPAPEEGDEFGEYVFSCAGERNMEITEVTYDDLVFSLGNAEFTVIPPLGAADDNEKGLAIIVSSGHFDVLITGDMSGETEQRLLDYADIPKLEVLVVGHHGSRYSTSEELLQETHPDTAIISVGINSYGHPSQHTIDRLEKTGAEVFRTDINGTITVKLGENTDG